MTRSALITQALKRLQSVGVPPLVGAGRGRKVRLLHDARGREEHLVRAVLLLSVRVDALQRAHLHVMACLAIVSGCLKRLGLHASCHVGCLKRLLLCQVRQERLALVAPNFSCVRALADMCPPAPAADGSRSECVSDIAILRGDLRG